MSVKNLAYDIGMRHVFEYVVKILLRREKHDLYVCRQYRSIQELERKHNLVWDKNLVSIRELFEKSWNKCDLVQLHVVHTEEDGLKLYKIINVECYEVKTKWHSVDRNYYEFCKSNFDFMATASKQYNIPCKIVSIILRPNWFYTFNIYNFADVPKHIYEYKPKQTKPYYYKKDKSNQN